MAVILSKTVSTSLISLVVSITIISVAIVLNLYLPLISEFLTSGLPVFCVSLKSWLTPPYLYIVINFIILTIAASSRFQQKIDQHMESFVPEALAPVKIQQDFVVPMVYDDKSIMVNSPVEVRQEVGGVVGYDDEFVVIKSPVELRQEVGNVIGDEFSMENRMMSVELELVPEVFEMDKKIEVSVAAEKDEAEIVTSSRDIEMPSRTESVEIPVNYSFSKQKPPVSARFGHRKVAKTSPEAGKSLRVTKPKRQDTLESTWKMITEGRSIPLARHLKKSDTWETHARLQDSVQNEQVTKSETFNCQTNVSSTTLVQPQGSGKLRSQGSGLGKLRKESSLTQDDLNRRVEAFINKFNEEMRLQRMESLNRYKQMINR